MTTPTPETPAIPDEAVTVIAALILDSMWQGRELDSINAVARDHYVTTARKVLAAALPVLNTATGEHVHTAACEHQRVSTEVIGADECHHCGPHLDGLCPNACPVAEDEARAAFEAASLRSEIADRIERYANSLVVSARMDDLIGTAEAAARNPIKSDLLELAASLRGEQG